MFYLSIIIPKMLHIYSRIIKLAPNRLQIEGAIVIVHHENEK